MFSMTSLFIWYKYFHSWYRSGLGARGSGLGAPSMLGQCCDHSGWCDCTKHFNLMYEPQLISSSVASRSMVVPQRTWMCLFFYVCTHDYAPSSHVAATLHKESTPLRAWWSNSLTCQSFWTWMSLSHQVCLPCVLMTPLLPEEVSCPLSSSLSLISPCADGRPQSSRWLDCKKHITVSLLIQKRSERRLIYSVQCRKTQQLVACSFFIHFWNIQ